MEKNKKGKFYLALVIFSLVGQIAWIIENMYFNVFIYKMFNASASDISIMVSASAVAATLTTIFIGALADKMGKRKMFISFGYIIWGLTIWSFALINVDIIGAIFPTLSATSTCITLVIVMDCVMTFFGSSANDAAFNAWLTDSTDHTNRGAAEGINSMMPLVAILVVFGGFMAFDLNLASSWNLIFTIIGVIVILIGVLGIFLIEDPKVDASENSSYFGNIIYGFRPDVIVKNKMLYLGLIAFSLFGISIQIFMPYLILYYEVSLGMKDYVLIMAPAIILASVFTAFYGRLYDKYGFIKTIFPAVAMLAVGYVILFLFKDVVMVFIGSLLMMSGYLSGMAIFGALIREKIPENKSGMFQGLRIVGQVLIPGVIGPMIGSWVLADAEKIVGNDGTESFIPNEKIFLAALIVSVIVIAYLVGLHLINKSLEGKKVEEITK